MRSNVFYLFCGLTGSGKTTLAYSFAQSRRLAYLDYDTVVQPLLSEIERRGGIGDSRAAFYRSWRPSCYESFWNTASEILSTGSSLVASAPCGQEIEDETFFSRLKDKAKRDFDAVGVYLAPQRDFHYEMMKRRNAIWNDDIIPNWNEYCLKHIPHRPKWDADWNIYLEYSSFEELSTRFSEAMSPVLAAQKVEGVTE